MEDPQTKLEIEATATRRLSASSTGSLPPCSEYNPFVKAQGQQRKDFSYVTNLRKEVIQIVEPYRTRVLTFDDRIGALEKIVLDLEFQHNEFKDEVNKNARKYASKDSLHNRISEIRKAQLFELNQMHEKVALMNAKVDGFNSKLNNSEEFNKAFKTIMESLKI